MLTRGLNSSRRLLSTRTKDAAKASPTVANVDVNVSTATSPDNQLSEFAPTTYTSHISARGQNLLQTLSPINIKYDRGGNAGEGYLTVQQIAEVLANTPEYPTYYSQEELDGLVSASDAVQNRMRIKVSKQYMDHCMKVPDNAKHPHPVLPIVLPDLTELDEVEGEADPSNQNRYSPMSGLLHKYEMLLAMISINCSAHCRYCYRSDLFNGISNKSRANIDIIALYARRYNALIEDAVERFGVRAPDTGLMVHKETGESLLPVREILFSGGDPLTLPNSTLARYMVLMAESGIRTCRFGTKEFQFNPARFDENFFATMDAFHEQYPEVRIEIVGHYSHPFELLDAKTDENGEYLYDISEDYAVRADIVEPLNEINKRGTWLGHFNQFPLIAGVNDRADILRLIFYASNRLGITVHNVYACREIIGNKHFRKDNDIPKQFKMVQQAKIGLSGVENHARLIMSTEHGKMEVVDYDADEEVCTMRLNRYTHGNKVNDSIVKIDVTKIEDGNGKFYWLTEDIINSPALIKGHNLYEELEENDRGFIRQIKDQAGAYCTPEMSFKSEDEAEKDNIVSISIFSGDAASKATVDLSQEKEGVTLAEVLSRFGAVEAACKCALSCSTCVGFVDSDMDLAERSMDEEDLIDTVRVEGEDMSRLRATCCLKLKGGEKYQFRGIDLWN